MNANTALNDQELLALATTAALEVAPLFALDRFVATNPFLGHAAQPFAEAARELALTRSAKLFPSRQGFRQALKAGEVRDADIAAALAAHGLDAGTGAIGAVKLALAAPEPGELPTLPTAAALLHCAGRTNWTSFVIDQLSRFCAAMANAKASPKPEALIAAWREEIELDLSAKSAGLVGLDAHLRRLPRTVAAMLATGQLATGLSASDFTLYLKRLLGDVVGWAAFWRGKQWDEDQQSPGAVLDLLAIRLGWDIALIAYSPALAAELRDGVAAAIKAARSERASVLDAIMQDALENAWRRELFGRLGAASVPLSDVREAVHAVFCIDVRSEPLRRALEAQDPRISTGGFAGFFGLPLEVMGADREVGAAHCPALLSPSLSARFEGGSSSILQGWNSLLDSSAQSPVTSLGFVEVLGLGYAFKHAAAAVAPNIGRRALSPWRKPLAYTISRSDGTPLTLSGRVDFAAAMLRGMGLTSQIAPVVVLVGHGASTRNNAHAASFNCGACGGHSGEANAVVAAELLNDPAVRIELAKRALAIPTDTEFVPALHDTTTGTVTFLLDLAQPIPDAVQQAIRFFAAATKDISRPPHQSALPGTAVGRSQDWSAVRPEWGLAGCAAFIAGPRALTRNIDLQGTAFLHTYDWHVDEGFAVLEQILTAPLIVASWINLQYYAATRDNARFGGGNKLIHNVVAGIGVIEGAGGDLRPGLPMQSLHDGDGFVHTALRLTALVEAPGDAILGVIGRQQHLRQLLDNHWISLFRTADGVPVTRYGDGLRWIGVADATAKEAA